MNEQTAASDAVVIARTFDAPVSLIYQMWTVPEHFTAWYGPDGVTVIVSELDVRVGGRRLVGMEVPSPRGLQQMWFAGEFIDVVENERLIYTEFLSDRHGAPLDSPVVGHPQVTEVRVELAEAGGRTRMVMTHAGIPSDSPGAAGWAVAFDKLARLVVGL